MLTITNINKILNTNIKYNDKKIYNMILNFYDDNEIFDESSLAISIIYIKRYLDSCKQIPKNIDEMIETSLILSNKFILDVDIKGCGNLEKDFLQKLDWNLFVNENEYIKYNNLIKI